MLLVIELAYNQQYFLCINTFPRKMIYFSSSRAEAIESKIKRTKLPVIFCEKP